MPRHEWFVMFRNDKMGFTKSFDLEAIGIDQAINFAWARLEKQSYKRDDFLVIEVRRGREVGT